MTRKRFGQNFLIDPDVIEAIIAAIAPRAEDLIIEIGPGRQALTAPLAASGADLVVVEIDRDLARAMQAGGAPFTVVNQDALDVDFAALAASRPYRLVGNLPYNVSTPLLFHVLAQRPPATDMHFMLQQEVVQRLVAAPGSRNYGRLTVMCRNLAELNQLLRVGPDAFRPAPRVESAFIRMKPRVRPLVPEYLHNEFARIVNQSFAQRRKTLRNSLKGLLETDDIEAAGVDPAARAEQLEVNDFARLAGLLA